MPAPTRKRTVVHGDKSPVTSKQLSALAGAPAVDVDGELRLLHKTTADTAESFGPLTLVDGRLWTRVALRPRVYRLRLLNGSNARIYWLHLVAMRQDVDGVLVITP